MAKDDLKLGVNAIQVLRKRYLLRDKNGKVIETPSELFRRVARTIASAEKKENKKWENRFYELMTSRQFMPNTPCLMNAGARLHQLSACFVVEIQDSVKSIDHALDATAIIHQTGGGTGFSFSNLRPKDDRVASTGGRASGPISFMKIFDQLTETMRQGGVRRGANMGILRVDHPDILEFIRLKENPQTLRNFNLSVSVTDKFMKAVEKKEDYYLINPRTGKAHGKLNAREVFDLIAREAWQTGDPGVIFSDEVNRKNPTKHIGLIESTNPCGEVPLHSWESCNLGSLNLSLFTDNGSIDWGKLKSAVRDSVRFLDNMIDVNHFPLSEVKIATLKNRRVGLGVMGLAEMLILLGIPYNSNKALKTADKLIRFIEDEALNMSEGLGKERGSFTNFKGSLWQKKGFRHMRNATTIVIAPTGTISIIAGCSSGIEPLFAVSFVRNVMEGEKMIESNQIFAEIAKQKGFFSNALLMSIAKTGSVQGFKEIPKTVKKLFVTAHEISPEWHVKMQAVFQKHTHGAVSKTINLPKDASIEDVRKAYLLAWKLKCKGITVYRYGSKAEQVLSFGDKNQPVTVESEFAGGCPAGVCSQTTT